MAKTVIKELNRRTVKESNYLPVPCRICGKEWYLPRYIAEQHNSDRGFECQYCRTLYGGRS